MIRVRTSRSRARFRKPSALLVGALLAFESGCGPNSSANPDLGAELDAELDATIPDESDACALAMREPENELAEAACRALGPFVRGEFDIPFDILLGDVTARRFDVEPLAHLWGVYARALADEPSVQLRTYARLGDSDAAIAATDLDMLGPVDSYTGRALHCVDHALPPDFADSLEANHALGSYATTHVLLALIWLRDLGCESPTSPAFMEMVLAATAALVDADHSVTSDLEIESAALLAYLGEAHRLPAGFLPGVVANQHAGGGWSELAPDGAASGHTSGLALWYLYESLFPGRTAPMVSAAPRRR